MGFAFIHQPAPFVAHPPGLGLVPDVRERKQRRVHQHAASYHDAAGIELLRDRLEQQLVQIQADQDVSETHGGRALRRGFVCGKATGSNEARPIVQCLGQAHVGKVLPCHQQQRQEQRKGRSAQFSLRCRADSGQHPVDLRPIYQSAHLAERVVAATLATLDRQLLICDPTPRHRRLMKTGDDQIKGTVLHGSAGRRSADVGWRHQAACPCPQRS